jgi:hypothetical protein
MEKKDVFDIMQEAINSMFRSGVLKEEQEIQGTTVILGGGSALDSIGFVTFVSELEDRVCENTGKEIFFALDDIHKYSAGQNYLSAEALAAYVVDLVNSLS